MFIKVISEDKEDILDLDKANGLEKFDRTLLIHFNNEKYEMNIDQPEYQLVLSYFEDMLEQYGYKPHGTTLGRSLATFKLPNNNEDHF